MNNYQEALEVISEYIGSYDNNTMLDVAMNELQRLIDIHDIDYVVIAKQSRDLKKLEKSLVKLEKALDKSLDMYFRKGTYLFPNKEALKEYLLKESEKQ